MEKEIKLIKGMMPNLTTIIVLTIFILVFKPSILTIISLVFLNILVTDAYQVIRKKSKLSKKRLTKNIVGVTIFFTIIIITYRIAGVYGPIAIASVPILIAGYYLVKNRKVYMEWVRHIERTYLYDGKTAEERKKK